DGDVVLQIIRDGGVEGDRYADLGEPAAEPLRVGVQALAAGELAADGDDLGLHGDTRAAQTNRQSALNRSSPRLRRFLSSLVTARYTTGASLPSGPSGSSQAATAGCVSRTQPTKVGQNPGHIPS